MNSTSNAWRRTAREDGRLGSAERDVLQAYAAGSHTREVAERLGLPPEIVRDRLARAMHALGARSKLEAVVVAANRGIIALGDGRASR